MKSFLHAIKIMHETNFIATEIKSKNVAKASPKNWTHNDMENTQRYQLPK